MSDRERTLEALGADVSEERLDKLRSLFGKLKVVYTESNYTTEMDAFSETLPYTVLGSDKHSVAIRDDGRDDPEMELFELTSFSVIHFDGENAYWVTTAFGEYKEYFKRVSEIAH